jgi:hypothetical protein
LREELVFCRGHLAGNSHATPPWSARPPL